VKNNRIGERTNLCIPISYHQDHGRAAELLANGIWGGCPTFAVVVARAASGFGIITHTVDHRR
jgi:hypothetical protein